MNQLPNRIVNWFRDLPSTTKLIIAGLVLLLLFTVLLSPLVLVAAALLLVVSIIALIIRSLNSRRELRGAIAWVMGLSSKGRVVLGVVILLTFLFVVRLVDTAVDAATKPNYIRGTKNGERLTGTGGRDSITGEGGKDILVGDRGNDVIDAGDRWEKGTDRVDAGEGDDIVRSRDRHDKDVIDCGPGNDKLTADQADEATNCEEVNRDRFATYKEEREREKEQWQMTEDVLREVLEE